MNKLLVAGGLLLAIIGGYAGIRYVSGSDWGLKWAPDPWRWGLPPEPHVPWPTGIPAVPPLPPGAEPGPR